MTSYEILTGLAWPMVTLIIGFAYRGILDRKESIQVKLPGGGEISVSGPRAEAKLQAALRDMEDVFRHLLNDEQLEFFASLVDRNTTPRVVEAIPDWDREKNKRALGMLRALRGLGLIDPDGGGKWEADKRIKVTGFGYRKADYLREILADTQRKSKSSNR